VSRRDYIALAAVLSRHDLPAGLADELCDLLKADNPRFDRDRFLAASLPAPRKLPRPRTLAAVALDEMARAASR
jgi:hypothetical protein